MKELVRLGAQVQAISPSGEFSDRFRDHGIEHVPFSMDRTTFNLFEVREVISRLEILLRDLKLDVLHTFTLRPNAYGAIAGNNAKIPVVINTVTGLGSLYSSNLGIKGLVARTGVNWLTRLALRSSSAVVFQNPDDSQYYQRHRLARSQQIRMIIGSGVDTDLFAPNTISNEIQDNLRNKWGIAQDDVVVTMIARLLGPKGVHEYLEAARQLSDQARFVLIGDPDFGNPASLTRDSLRKFIESGHLIAPGHQENIAEWLSITDIYALPSYREGLPRTVLEAMAMQLPIVTTDVPGCRETVMEGENGFLIPAQNPSELKHAIEKLIASKELRERLGACSRVRAVESFSNKVILKEYLNLYAELFQDSKCDFDSAVRA